MHHRNLEAWKESINFVTEIYTLTKKFPKEELWGLTSQIRRASISIPSNIAEGYGRKSKTEYSRFLDIARGSLFELETQIELSYYFQYLDEENYSKLC